MAAEREALFIFRFYEVMISLVQKGLRLCQEKTIRKLLGMGGEVGRIFFRDLGPLLPMPL